MQNFFKISRQITNSVYLHNIVFLEHDYNHIQSFVSHVLGDSCKGQMLVANSPSYLPIHRIYLHRYDFTFWNHSSWCFVTSILIQLSAWRNIKHSFIHIAAIDLAEDSSARYSGLYIFVGSLGLPDLIGAHSTKRYGCVVDEAAPIFIAYACDSHSILVFEYVEGIVVYSDVILVELGLASYFH